MIETQSLHIEETSQSRLKEVDFKNLQFGRTFTDHMFVADYQNGTWQDLRVIPYGNLPLSPATMGIHYAQSIFEGMKAFKTPQGNIQLFRPLENARRLNRSAERMCMATLPEEIFMEGLNKLLELDKNWVPGGEGESLYIRPFMFASDEYVGLKVSDNYRFMIIASPVGAYYSKAVRVKIETHYARAVKGGVGAAKAAGNYGASLYPAKLAQDAGYDQLIWTDGIEHRYIEEAGTMNLIFKIDGKIISPELGDTILPGINRKSVLELARHEGFTVEERPLTVEELVTAIQKGKLEEAFGAGTAAVVTAIKTIGYDGIDYELPDLNENSFAMQAKKKLVNIQTGKAEDNFGWMHVVC